MNAKNILIFYSPSIQGKGNVGNPKLQELIRLGAVFCDWYDTYYRYGKKGAERYIENFINSNGIDTLIYTLDDTLYYYSPDFFERIRKNIFVVMIAGDSEYYYNVRDQYYAQAADLVIGDDFTIVPKLNQIGVNAINCFAYYETTQLYRIENMQKDIDVSFIGHIRGLAGRPDNINYLKNNGINVRTFGRNSESGWLGFEEYRRIICRSRINLNFSGLTNMTRWTGECNINKRKTQMKGRVFEVLFCGGFLLTEYFYGVEKLLEVGREIEVYSNKEELLKKVRYYLENESQREAIAERGYKRAVNDYNVKTGIMKILEEVEAYRKKKKYELSQIYFDRDFIRNYTTFRVLLIIRFIKAGKWKEAFEEFKIVLRYRELNIYLICVFITEEILDKFPIKIRPILRFLFKGKQVWKNYS